MRTLKSDRSSQTYMVVGAGLAGCLLAWRLQQAGRPVTLIGSTTWPCASAVAAGVINPVTGRWMTKTWGFDALLPHALATYRELEQQFGIELYHPIRLTRYCQYRSDTKRMGRRMRNPRYASVLGEFIAAGDGPSTLLNHYGSFQIKQAAYVDLPQLLQVLRQHFAQQRCFRDHTFMHAELHKHAERWTYHDLSVDHIIFSEGVGMLGNPWFNWLPLRPAKGETLTLQCPTLHLPRGLYHHRKWLLAYGNHHFRLGATFNSADSSDQPTAAGAQQLLESAQSFMDPQHQLQIKQHDAGRRPCTEDFRPFIGNHPSERGLHIFNGLGAKAALLAPELTRQFLAYLLTAEALNPEINSLRYADLCANPIHIHATH